MAGANITLDVDTGAITAALQALGEGVDTTALFREIGAHLELSTDERFGREESPDGVRWAPLSQATIASKRRNKNKILVESGNLRELMRYQLEGTVLGFGKATGVRFGTDRKYGAFHQFGGETPQGHRVPARPFLGVSHDDTASILQIIEKHVQRAVERAAREAAAKAAR